MTKHDHTTESADGVSEHEGRERDLERYKQLVEAMGDGIYALDADGRYTMMNDAFLELLGYEREAVIGSRPTLIQDDEEIERFERNIKDLLTADGEDAKTVESTLQTADGERVPIEVTLTLLPCDHGEFRGTVGVVRDITERKEREQQLEWYRAYVEYQEKRTELSQKRVELNTLEVEQSEEELQNSEKYTRLTARIEELEAELEELENEYDDIPEAENVDKRLDRR